ncbi:hypothetical protein LTR70_007815 [Exophiala xenobiotica]|uniref:Uncharacterized protein n=1 Tax=Lithohypha guttulata TaxID=1690604 RepID=A0ABR0K305_9EURO|nr:hypothetical protein LTR24_007426 [Lithohypha guttulata]KAK5313060.1 hypothetical protein LTR70_007815 [Exophiala xenobiotica]
MEKAREVTPPPDKHEKQQFERPYDPQESSRLLRLPSELRLKILRLLHKAEKPLNSCEAIPITQSSLNGHAEALEDAESSIFELSGQVLACCQQLEIEASAILYGENVLRMRCTATSDVHLLNIHCLGAHIQFERRLPYLNYEEEIHNFMSAYSGLQVYDLISKLPRFNKNPHSHVYSVVEGLLVYRFIKNFHQLSKIRNIRLVVQYHGETDVFMACIALRAMLLDKNVVLVPRMTASGAHIIQDGGGVVNPQLENLNPCRMLRCRSITFESNLSLARLVDEIVSEKEVDLFFGWPGLMRLIRSLPQRTDRNLQRLYFVHVQEHSTTFNKLQIAVLRVNAIDAKIYSARLLQQISKWNEEVAEQKAVEAKGRYEFVIAQTRKHKERIRQQVKELDAEVRV